MVSTEDSGHGHYVAAVAAAMVRHVLPATATLRLEITSDDYSIWLHLAYRAGCWGTEPASRGAADDLTLINSMALRWGHFGDTHWHTLWALVAPPNLAGT